MQLLSLQWIMFCQQYVYERLNFILVHIQRPIILSKHILKHQLIDKIRIKISD